MPIRLDLLDTIPPKETLSALGGSLVCLYCSEWRQGFFRESPTIVFLLP